MACIFCLSEPLIHNNLQSPFEKPLKERPKGDGKPVSESRYRNAGFRAFEAVPTGVCEPNVRLER